MLFTLQQYTVATLPPAILNLGEIFTVTDSDASQAVAAGKVVVGGGTTRIRVLSDGNNWRVLGNQVRGIGDNSGTAPPFTPASLNPRVWIDARNRTGNTPVTAITNAGSDGGTPSIIGTINTGTSLGGMPTLRIDNNTKRINLVRPVHGTSGILSVFWFGALLGTGADQGYIGMDWSAGADAIASYLSTSGGTSFFFAAGLPFGAGSAPCWSRTNYITDTNKHAVYTCLSTTNKLYLDKVSLSFGASHLGAAPNYASQTWNFGCAHTTESVNADNGAWLVFDYDLNDTQITNLSNFYINM